MKGYILSSTLLLCISMAVVSPLKQRDPAHFETETEALDGIAFVAAMQNYPHVTMRDGHWYAAYTGKKEMQRIMRTDGADIWESIGPNNVGGRTISIALDPLDTAIIYMGSASGGLWKSTTGGQGVNAWTYIETGFPILGVSAIAINPVNNQEIFIGTGETYSYGSTTHGLITRTERGSLGMGILHTTDGGSTWEISLDWTYQESRGIWDIVFHPDNTAHLVAATTEGIYVSEDGGASWTQTATQKMAMDISVHPDAPDVMYAGVGNLNSDFHGLLRSEDGGLSWSEVTGGGWPDVSGIDGRICVKQWDGDANTVFATIGNAFSTVGMYRSTDGGSTWTQLDDEEVLSYQGWYAKGILAHPDNANLLLFGGVELWKSTNAGASIIQKTTYSGPDSELHPDLHEIICNPLAPDQVYILTDGGLFRSGDFGESYYPCNDGYATAQFYIGSISGSDPDIGLGGLQDNFTQRYTGTPYWEAKIGGDGAANAIDQEDDSQQYGSYQYGNFYKSSDQGENFFDYIFGPSGASAFVAPITLAPSDQQVIYTGDTRLWRSDDGGGLFYKPVNLQPDTGNVFLAIGVGGNGPDTLYFSTAGISGRADIFRSVDGGESFTCITNALPDRYYRDIAVDPQDAQIVYVTLSGFGSGHVYKSIDGGDTWTDISEALPDVPFHTVLVDPDNTDLVYAGGDMGVYLSTDQGATWNIYGTGMPEAVLVFDLVLSQSDDQVLAFTHGNGAYRIPKFKEEQVEAFTPNGDMELTLYPTATQDILNVSTTTAHASAKIQIFNSEGRVVFFEEQPFAAAEPYMISTAHLAKGQYFVRVILPTQIITKPFVRM